MKQREILKVTANELCAHHALEWAQMALLAIRHGDIDGAKRRLHFAIRPLRAIIKNERKRKP